MAFSDSGGEPLDARIRVNWVGPQFAGHSIAVVNRNLCRELERDPRLLLRMEVPPDEMMRVPSSRAASFAPFSEADAAVVHEWTPGWGKPAGKRRICMQAWEYGAIPREWFIPMTKDVDEIWVYSSYNKECYVRCGIPAEKVQVIPLGVDESVFRPEVAPMRVGTAGFRFLFVGGTIVRKGIDLLLQAYVDEFTADDDVCLVIKDNGAGSFYKGKTFQTAIRKVASRPRSPRIVYLDRHLSETEMAGLYAGCDCLVHPYRGEGFGLPIAEAMACGLPVIVPDQGPSRDLCDGRTAFLLPAEVVGLPEQGTGLPETVGPPWWLSVDKHDLQKTMRVASENRALVQAMGRAASERMRSAFTWKHSAEAVLRRLQSLAEKE
ncbi:glycosyltransferase [Brevibacillus thermoruber]|uniref:glycosyltransferase n=1 Tax=Brevibacillus thermoruber TaxID=33942 RepID=UPI000492087F|nr:glycosyltransferase [Brevibacillus thermoruber]